MNQFLHGSIKKPRLNLVSFMTKLAIFVITEIKYDEKFS